MNPRPSRWLLALRRGVAVGMATAGFIGFGACERGVPDEPAATADIGLPEAVTSHSDLQYFLDHAATARITLRLLAGADKAPLPLLLVAGASPAGREAEAFSGEGSARRQVAFVCALTPAEAERLIRALDRGGFFQDRHAPAAGDVSIFELTLTAGDESRAARLNGAGSQAARQAALDALDPANETSRRAIRQSIGL